jgi:hypothetical protein
VIENPIDMFRRKQIEEEEAKIAAMNQLELKAAKL